MSERAAKTLFMLGLFMLCLLLLNAGTDWNKWIRTGLFFLMGAGIGSIVSYIIIRFKDKGP